MAEVTVVGNLVLFGLVFHQKPVSVQHDRTTVLSTLLLWISLNIDIGLITERKWKLLPASIIHHTRAVGIVLATWTVHHLVTCQNLCRYRMDCTTCNLVMLHSSHAGLRLWKSITMHPTFIVNLWGG